MITEMNNTLPFTSNREIFLALIEVTQENVFRFALKLAKSLTSGVITVEQFDGHVELLERHCKDEGIDTRF